ncbi:hypothetical protein [Paenibacillus sp. BAC0078]
MSRQATDGCGHLFLYAVRPLECGLAVFLWKQAGGYNPEFGGERLHAVQ